MKHVSLILAVFLVSACNGNGVPAARPIPKPLEGVSTHPNEEALPNLLTIVDGGLLHARTGRLVKLSGYVINNGAVPAAFAVRWSIGGVEVAATELGPLAPGGEVLADTWIETPDLPTGIYDLTLAADPKNALAEAYENDNARVVPIEVLNGFDREVAFAEVSTPYGCWGDVISMRLRWRNDGSQAAPATAARVVLYGPLPATTTAYLSDVTVPALAPGAEATVGYLVQPWPGACNYRFQIELPVSGAEIDPGDNTALSAAATYWTSRLVPVWSAPTTTLTGAPAWGTFTNDGVLQMVYGTGSRNFPGHVTAVTAATGALLWSANITDVAFGIPAVGDADGDGTLEIYLAAREGLYSLSATNGAIRWHRSFGFTVATPVLTDMVPANGTLEVVVTAGFPAGGVLAVLRADTGADVFSYAEPSTDMTFSTFYFGGPAVADVNGDGRLDIGVDTVARNGAGYVGVYAGTETSYTLLWSQPTANELYRIAPVLIDVDADGKSDLLVGNTSGALTALRGFDGQMLWQQTRAGRGIEHPLALGDVDGDARPEVAVFWTTPTTATDPLTTLALLHVTTGATLWSLEFKGRPVAGAVLADLDGDGRNDVVAAIDTPSHTCLIFTVSATGSVIDVAETAPCQYSLGILDADGDGRYEIMAGQLQLLDTPYAVGAAAWPKQGRDAGNRSAY